MRFLSNTAQIRKADQLMIEGEGYPGILLMETAGRKSAEYILEHYGNRNLYLVLVGPGNNGGDGLVIARYLHWAGKRVLTLCAGNPDKFKGDALLAWQAFQALDLEVWTWVDWKSAYAEEKQVLPKDALVVDALLGTGINSALRPPISDIIQFFSERSPEVVAIDLPSGLSADTGALINPALSASATLTFQLPKLCHYISPASNYCGKVITLDIGIREDLVGRLGIRRKLMEGGLARKLSLEAKGGERPLDAHKGSFGHALLIGGSRDMAGAIALAGRSALYIGAGLSTVFVPGAARCAFYASGSPEVMNRSFGGEEYAWLGPGAVSACLEALPGKNAVAIGPGMGASEQSAEFLRGVLPYIQVPLVLDADALNLLASHDDLWDLLPEVTLLTPHPGEMKRLSGAPDVQAHRLEIAEGFVKERKVILILKGAGTLVCLPKGQTYVNTTGNPGMGTAGAGDVLTGALVGLLAQGYSAENAAVLGVYLHGRSGDLIAGSQGQAGVTAAQIMEGLSPAWQSLLSSQEPKTGQI